MYQLKNFDFKENLHGQSINVLYKNKLVGYIHEKTNDFIQIYSSFFINETSKKAIFLKEIDNKIMSNEKHIFRMSVRNQFDINNNLKHIQSLKDNKSQLNFIDEYTTLLFPYLESLNINIIDSFNSYCLRNKDVNSFEEYLKSFNVENLFDENLFSFYPFSLVKDSKHYPSSSNKLISKNFLTHCISNGKMNLLDIKLKSNLDKDIHLVEQNLNDTIKNKDMFLAVLDVYTKGLLLPDYIFGLFGSVFFFIKDDILFVQQNQNDKDMSDLLFNLYLFGK